MSDSVAPESLAAALLTSAARMQAMKGHPPNKDLQAAAATVLAAAMEATLRAAGHDPTSHRNERDAVVAACMLQMCAQWLAAGLAFEGLQTSVGPIIADASRSVFVTLAPEARARVMAGGALALKAVRESRHPRAGEIAGQIGTCFGVFVWAGDPKAVAALKELYSALLRASI